MLLHPSKVLVCMLRTLATENIVMLKMKLVENQSKTMNMYVCIMHKVSTPS